MTGISRTHKEIAPNIGILLISVLIIASCGIFYELLIGTISTYFLGSSVLHFSITIGIFLFFMGVGSFLSRFIHEKLLMRFVEIEIALAIIGGFSSFILHFSFSFTESYYFVAILLMGVLGTFIGLEIPLVIRIVNLYSTLKEAVSNVFSFDYVGALAASIIFPVILLPNLGVMRTSFFIGLLNLSVVFLNLYIFRKHLDKIKHFIFISFSAAIILIAGFMYSFSLVGLLETKLYQDNVILTKQSAYQRIVVTRWNHDLRLYINGNLQFSSVDEHRYHEGLVHIPMLLANNHEKILILGGGDGLALREIWKYKDVKHVDLVDLDPIMTELAKSNANFLKLNNHSMSDSRLTIYNQDAYNFIKNSSDLYSVIIIDLPDPNDNGLGKLYTKEFYKMLEKRLAADGVMVNQSTSPFFSRKAYWCIIHTAKSIFKNTFAYTVYVPTFGQWGYTLALGNNHKISSDKSSDTVYSKKYVIDKLQRKLYEAKKNITFKYLSSDYLPSLFVFDNEMAEIHTEINTLDNQKLVEYYEESLFNWR